MFEFKLPDLGEGIQEGELIKWYVKVGDKIKEDDPLCDLETDKATVTIPSPRAGVIAQLNVNPGETLTVGSVLVKINENSNENINESIPPEPLVDPITSEEKTDIEPRKNKNPTVKKAVAAPATRRLAREMGIDINTVSGTGPGGKVIKEDLQHAIENKTIKTPLQGSDNTQSESGTKKTTQLQTITLQTGIPFFEMASLPDFSRQGPVEKVPVKSLRKKTAVKTTSSMILVPHVAHMDECDVTELEALRKNYNATHPLDDKLTLMAFLIKAVSSVLQHYPAFNASIDPEKMEIIYKKFYHIGFAADTPKGLMVPVIRDADTLNITLLAKKIQDLAGKGRQGTISLPELSYGSFTITNVGVIGGTGLVPIINYPESAILGMGRVSKKPVVREDAIVIREILPLTLCFDHRIADGAEAARFMNHLKRMLEDPVIFMTGI